MPAYPAVRPNDPDTSALVERIPGWGVDADPADRPAVPKELPVGPAPGVHWQVPEEQPGREGRERSNEHAFLPPVFGTSTPMGGLSGIVRRRAYRFSEARRALVDPARRRPGGRDRGPCAVLRRGTARQPDHRDRGESGTHPPRVVVPSGRKAGRQQSRLDRPDPGRWPVGRRHRGRGSRGTRSGAGREAPIEHVF